MPAVLCKCYWNKFFLIIVQRGEPDSSDVVVCQKTGRQTHLLFHEPIMTHNLHVMSTEQLELNNGTFLLHFKQPPIQVAVPLSIRVKKKKANFARLSANQSVNTCVLLGEEGESKGATAGDQMSEQMRRLTHAVNHGLMYQSMAVNLQRFDSHSGYITVEQLPAFSFIPEFLHKCVFCC